MALNGTLVKIDTVTVGSGGAANIEFTNIPQTYTDLKIVLSARGTRSAGDSNVGIAFNGSTSSFSNRYLEGNGSAAASGTLARFIGGISAATATASTHGSIDLYIPNYSGSTNKSFSSDAVMETNGTPCYAYLTAGLWSNTAAITTVTLSLLTSDNFAQYSTATLYGIKNNTVATGAKAEGGIITSDSTYWYHVFQESGTFTPLQNLTVDYLVVAGGGSGGWANGGGGGAGGYRTGTGFSVSNGVNYAVTIGAGGAAQTVTDAAGNNGSNSVFSTITSTGGGGGGGAGSANSTGKNGGSGGGSRGFYGAAGGLGNTPSTSPSQGNNGGAGSGSGASPSYGSGGGGGAGATGSAGTSTSGGAGGNGTASSITGTSVTYAGGGGGGTENNSTPAPGGTGGGGNGGNTVAEPTPGAMNTGGGGGGGGTGGSFRTSGAGGSGIVVLRYAK